MKTQAFFSRWFAMLALSVALVLPQVSVAEVEVIREQPTATAMVTDLVVIRPAMLVVTAVGTAAYVLSLPFSVLGGNSVEAAQTLMIGPAQATFNRCLGCTRSGYRHSVREVK